jgi:hypothetical protein
MQSAERMVEMFLGKFDLVAARFTMAETRQKKTPDFKVTEVASAGV